MKVSIAYNNNTTRVFTSSQKIIVGETVTLVLFQVPEILDGASATIQINATNLLPAFTGQDGNQNTGDITQVLTVADGKAEIILSSEQTAVLSAGNTYDLIIFINGYRTNSSGVVEAQAGGVLYHSITRIGAIAGSSVATPAQAFSLDFKTINGESILGDSNIITQNKESVIVGPSNADYITDGTDDQVQIQQAIDSLTSGRTWNEKVVIKGNINVSAKITVPSYTTIEVLGTVTFNSSWNPASTVLTGFFDITNGDASHVESVRIYGGHYIGQAYSSFPTRDTGNREYICVMHSTKAISNSYFGDFSTYNVGVPITFERLGAIDGDPSHSIDMKNIKIDTAWVGIQTYCNGYKYQGINIDNILFDRVEDDVVAICGHGAGIVGATAEFANVNIDNVAGAKNGTTGAVIKIDAGSTTIGKGIFRDINVSNVTSSTTGSNESLVALFQGDNVLSRNVQVTNTVGEGTFLRGFWVQSAFRGVIFSNFVLEATHCIQLQSTALPSDSQSVKFVDGVCKSPTSAVFGDGIVYSAGTALQGVRNVKLYNVDFENKLRPINEGSTLPDGTGVQGTYSNIYYDVDLRDRNLSNCVFTSTNRELRAFKNGQILTDTYLTNIQPQSITNHIIQFRNRCLADGFNPSEGQLLRLQDYLKAILKITDNVLPDFILHGQLSFNTANPSSTKAYNAGAFNGGDMTLVNGTTANFAVNGETVFLASASRYITSNYQMQDNLANWTYIANLARPFVSSGANQCLFDGMVGTNSYRMFINSVLSAYFQERSSAEAFGGSLNLPPDTDRIWGAKRVAGGIYQLTNTTTGTTANPSANFTDRTLLIGARRALTEYFNTPIRSFVHFKNLTLTDAQIRAIGNIVI